MKFEFETFKMKSESVAGNQFFGDDELLPAYANMKPSVMFKDQINTVTSWFTSWNECEQTVGIYSLLRKVNSRQLRFLQQVLQQSTLVEHLDTAEINLCEKQANDPGDLFYKAIYLITY